MPGHPAGPAVSRYTAPGDSEQREAVAAWAASDWTKTRKSRVRKATTEQMAKELIELYARRQQAKGSRLSRPDDDVAAGF